MIGFSTADRIVFGERAKCICTCSTQNGVAGGVGTACVRHTAALHFEALQLSERFCEPNAFNVAPNRTLQKAGFRSVKTHVTVPGPLHYHQAVTRW